MSKPYIYNNSVDVTEIHHALLERISKAESLVQLGVLDHVIEVVGSDVGNFLWILADLLTEIRELYEKLPAPTQPIEDISMENAA